MLISAGMRATVMYGGAIAGILGVVTLLVTPSATKGSSRSGAWLIGFVRWTAITLVCVGFGSAYWARNHTLDVLRIRDGRSDVGNRTIDRVLGMGNIGYAYAPTAVAPGIGSTSSTWIVNASSQPVRVEEHHYSSRQLMHVEAPIITAIPPGTMASFAGIDEIGPANPPQESVSVQYDPRSNSALTAVAERRWLTWNE